VWVVAFVASTWPLHQSDVILHDEECEWLHCWLQLVKFQLAMVPNGGVCGWLHLWHQHGHSIITFNPHYYVWVNVIYWWVVKSENFLIHYKRDYYYSWGIVWCIQLQLECDSSFDAHVMKFRVWFYVFILFIWSSVTMSVTCLCEWMRCEWVLPNSHLWVNLLVNSTCTTDVSGMNDDDYLWESMWI